ncbi:MAG: hypothetical protein E6J90_22485 [Deltaproteobacteria bacterium]|nr:MAG: hypothetical protein E6J90_22485 [Deltaproteobacteria bacterium]
MHLGRLLEILEVRVVLGDEQRIGRRQRRDELGVDREVVVDAVAGRARPPVAAERRAEEQVGADAGVDGHGPDHDARVLHARRDAVVERERVLRRDIDRGVDQRLDRLDRGLDRRILGWLGRRRDVRGDAPGPCKQREQDKPVTYHHLSSWC